MGRETALAEVTAGLRVGPGALTLVGPGGVGKTTLARHVAGALAASYPDGVVVAELAAVSDGDEVAAAVVAAVGAPGASAPGHDRIGRAVDVLRGRRLLLVLDNCEHVVDAAATLLEAVVAACPTVTVLATSREPLGVAGERVRPVPPLAEAAAVALFADRAVAACPDFALTDDNRAAVTEVCRRLDRLPLALEVAAARMRVHSAAELVAELPAHLRSLRSPRRSGEPRHRTLYAVVDWSYRLLDPAERALLDRLSVFAGDFTLAAARAVAGADEPDIDAVLVGLVDQSRLTATVDHARGGPSRYALLETVRAYARERLAERGETAGLRRRHAEQALGLLRRIGSLAGPRSADRLAAIDAEWDELRAAVGWATEHAPALAGAIVALLVDHAEARMTPELFAWADRLLAVATDLGPSAPTVHAVAAAGARFAGDLARAEAHVDAGLALLEGPDDPRGRHLAFLRAECALFAGRIGDAVDAAAEAERLAGAAGDGRVQLLSASTPALVAAYTGDVEDAVARADAL
ncbi:MAG TPA: AAA family ATPase, partial [Actinomycetospora sp.]|nr:AAA family ATPase [Actinomycetospora sp.]